LNDRPAQGKKAHEGQEERNLDGKGDEVGDEDGDRDGHAREIDLAKQAGIADEGVAGLGQAVGKVGPDDGAGHVEEELRQTVGGQVGNAAKDHGEGDGGQQGLDEVPERAQDGLFVD